jgi:hypothetical protein
VEKYGLRRESQIAKGDGGRPMIVTSTRSGTFLGDNLVVLKGFRTWNDE